MLICDDQMRKNALFYYLEIFFQHSVHSKITNRWEKSFDFKLLSKNAVEISYSDCGNYLYVKESPIYLRKSFIPILV